MVIGISVSLLTILIALAVTIALCILTIRFKKNREAQDAKEDPYYSTIHDLVEVTNAGVGMNRNQAYGTRSSVISVTSGPGMGGDAGLTAQGEEGHTSEHTVNDENLDEGGYVDVNQ